MVADESAKKSDSHPDELVPDHEPSSPTRELPELTFSNVIADILYGFKQLIFNPEFTKIVIPILLVVESIAVKLIKGFISYTEIDYTAYMEQVTIINSGELNYANIFGGTGPLVYPAGHVWIYRFLSWLTYGTKNIEVGQTFFGWLYVITLALVFLVYLRLNVPPWTVHLLTLSKRLHSIYVLRLFNDCFTTFFMVVTVLTLQQASVWKTSRPRLSKLLSNQIAGILFGIAISIKMNALLYLPGFGIAVYFLNNEVILRALVPLVVVVLTQAVISWQFLFSGAEIRDSYLANAFDFKRRFLYKWTVNWRFLSADIFNSTKFHHILLFLHIALLLTFLFRKWAKPSITGKSNIQLLLDLFKVHKQTVSPKHVINDPSKAPMYVMGVMASSNLIGIICSRSLHYQFLSWYAWTFPYMLYLGNINWIVSVILFVAHEWCWNVFPSTEHSSAVLLAINVAVIGGYFFNNRLEIKVENSKKVK
ncbi:Dolichyl-P-Man:Man(5)GlcNAc(2)-PP-dolichylmannosyltransferase [Wickerhamomyces ciferrii]|uniref:Dol-P-Man:Man(5)GlcNAc(2)-PP-Dol alpha-1,3-mannosyltransferase n=1 Tax=Wickerhamomyces ciferrii (strain ATCC 14091 / BCRC 22168 / CBS 111 / JCM 3599 / NBRC 0793 / NRRL Y-1031 F-60-10) TaxID=1206466 RepID=K0KP51_WICCF|nr:Dolichyl-P-Man:Man(5)GlcNAc(2)-PP-dolichylmannosyltransferase [Wickerhamomyces ciferrii]CCH44726.1 Dolichyl-P-Man:Man(5)GlcNAc(2)-PP-dolichylmannosyltransferase [Wickerhamomyces ciferrii]